MGGTVLRKRITETIHFAEFSLKLLQKVFSSLETLSRRSQKEEAILFFKLQSIAEMLLVQSYLYILIFYFCVLFPYRKYSAKGQTLKDLPD